MDEDTARQRLQTEREAINKLIADAEAARRQDRSAENEQGDLEDRAQPLTAEGVDDAVLAGLRERLAALDRAEQRLKDGMYGLSIRSGRPIPGDRLDADPAAELTVEEARNS